MDLVLEDVIEEVSVVLCEGNGVFLGISFDIVIVVMKIWKIWEVFEESVV